MDNNGIIQIIIGWGSAGLEWNSFSDTLIPFNIINMKDS